MISVSAIIPTYNRRDALRRALYSVLAQRCPVKEIIVIDDGSTDQTADMMQSEFPRVKYFYQENAGVSSARNSGIGLASGEWLAFLDSDDEWLPDKVLRQVSALMTQADARVCHTEEIWIRNGRRVNAGHKHRKKGGHIFSHCLPLCAMSPSSIMIHRSVFNSAGLFDESLPACEDYDLWLRITARYPVLFIEQPLIVKYGGHDDQLSRKYWGMDRFRIHALAKILDAGILTDDSERLAAVNMLRKKCAIFSAGALKRDKQFEAFRYQQIMDRFACE